MRNPLWSSGRALIQQMRGIGFESHQGRFPFLSIRVFQRIFIIFSTNILSSPVDTTSGYYNLKVDKKSSYLTTLHVSSKDTDMQAYHLVLSQK